MQEPDDLRLDSAMALLEQAGIGAPAVPATDRRAYLQAVIDGLVDLSQRDPLTGLSNRRHLNAVLEREIDRVARSGEAALLLMVDIDYFKRVNDTHGHLAGDEVIKRVAQVLADCVRPMDTLARYGGEEFGVVLPCCQAAFGRAVAERIRRSVEATPVRLPSGQDLTVTISIGGAFAMQWIRTTGALWMDRADQQLYAAKGAGRNRVHIEEPPDSTVSAEEKSLLFGHLSLGDPALWTVSGAASAPQ
jgi:two-component system, cell cycle response regulator